MSTQAIEQNRVKASKRQASDDLGGYELNRKRVYILPTRYGLAFLCALAVMALGSINYNNNLGFMLTFLLASLALVAILHTYKNIAGLTINCSSSRPVFAGQNARFNVALHNTDSEQRTQVVISYPLPRKLSYETRADVVANDTTRVPLTLATDRRGLVKLPKLTIWTRFPLGLLRAWSYVETQSSALVYPRPAGEPGLPLGHGIEQQGGLSSGQGNDDFSGLRDYVPGDSSRRIHWKNEARGNQTSVKQFSGATPEEIRLDWAHTPGDDLESKLSQLTLWILEAERQQIPYSLCLPHRTIARSVGTDQQYECLRELALFGLDHG